MGGGQSKKSEVKAVVQTEQKQVKQKPAAQKQPEQQAAQSSGPASKPNIDMSPSPAMSKKSGKSANIQQQSIQKYPVSTSQSSGLPRNESADGMDSMARPSAVAKQSKMESPSPQLQKGNQMEKQRKAEEEKMKQLQEIAKQNRAKKAAAAAAKAPAPSSYQKEEYFARDNSNQFQLDEQQMAPPTSMMGGLNSQPLALSVTGKSLQQQNQSKHMTNGEKYQQQFMMPQSAVAAPIVQQHFKVVSYDNDIHTNNFGNQGEQTQGIGGLNVGVMGQTNEMEKNREIDMAELHELLGN